MKEVLKLALEALEYASSRIEKVDFDFEPEITAIKEALAQPEQEPVVTDEMVDAAIQAFWGYEHKTVSRTAYRLAIQAALNKLATSMSLTSAKDEQDKFCDNNCVWTDHHKDCVRADKPEQEPVAWGNLANWCLDSDRVLLTDKDEAAKYHRDVYDLTPLYTTPPYVPTERQRTWVGLTDEEMKKVWYAMQNIMGWYSFQEIACAIEAKLKEKNT